MVQAQAVLDLLEFAVVVFDAPADLRQADQLRGRGVVGQVGQPEPGRFVLPSGWLSGPSRKRTHDYVRHGATNLFAALNVTTGEVLSECESNRNGASFLAFLEKARKPHAGTQIHVVLDNLSTYKPMRRNQSTTTRINTTGMARH
ncbi:hypothetical protein Z951_15725 [Streptomyces sp. PRh5]|nr:hypothetical protein Z951_15725 [Streptomyces sp. PRh5]